MRGSRQAAQGIRPNAWAIMSWCGSLHSRSRSPARNQLPYTFPRRQGRSSLATPSGLPPATSRPARASAARVLGAGTSESDCAARDNGTPSDTNSVRQGNRLLRTVAAPCTRENGGGPRQIDGSVAESASSRGLPNGRAPARYRLRERHMLPSSQRSLVISPPVPAGRIDILAPTSHRTPVDPLPPVECASRWVAARTPLPVCACLLTAPHWSPPASALRSTPTSTGSGGNRRVSLRPRAGRGRRRARGPSCPSSSMGRPSWMHPPKDRPAGVDQVRRSLP